MHSSVCGSTYHRFSSNCLHNIVHESFKTIWFDTLVMQQMNVFFNGLWGQKDIVKENADTPDLLQQHQKL